MSRMILRNTTAYTLASMVPNFINLGLLPLYTSLIPPEDFGVNALVSTICALLGSLAGLQVGTALVRYYVRYEGEALRTYVTTLLVFSFAFNLLVFGLLHLSGPWLTTHIFGRSNFAFDPYLLLGSFQFLFGGMTAYLNILLRMQERGLTFLVQSLIYSAVDFALGIYFVVVLETGVVGLLLARAISSGLYLVLLMRSLSAMFSRRLSLHGLRESIAFALPTVPHALGNTVFNFADKYLIGVFMDKSAVGLYDLANRFSRVFQRLLLGFERAYVPDFMRRSEEDKVAAAAYLRNVIAKWLVWCVLVALGLTLFAEDVINLMAAPAYHDAYPLVPILVTACMMRGFYYFPLNAILFAEKTRWIPIITLTSGALNILLNCWLIPWIGDVTVAAWTTLFSLAFAFALAWWASRKCYPLQWPWKISVLMLGGLFLCLEIVVLLPNDGLAQSVGFKTLLWCAFAGLVFLADLAGARQDLLGILLRRRSARQLNPVG